MKRIVIVNDIEFTTTTEEQITASLLKELWSAQENDRVVVEPSIGEPYPISDETVLLPDVNRVSIVRAIGCSITKRVEKISPSEETLHVLVGRFSMRINPQ